MRNSSAIAAPEWLGNALATLAAARNLDDVLEISLSAASALAEAEQAYAFIEEQGHVDEPISIYKSIPVVSEAEIRTVVSKANYSCHQPGKLSGDFFCFPLRSRECALGAILLRGPQIEVEHVLALKIFVAHTAVVLDNFILCHNEWSRLPNLSAIKPILVRALNETKGSVALFFIDIDDFKSVNSRVGYFGGAELLIQFASRLKKCSGFKVGWLGHISGDEFIFVLPFSTGGKTRLRETACAIKNAVQLPFFIQGQRLVVTVSIGISIYPQDAGSVKELFTHSDRAALSAKRAGKNAYRVYRTRAKR